jgi:alpha-galactosidase
MKNLFIGVLLLTQISAMSQKTQGLVLTPPMGWNSWNKFGCDINEKLIKETADAFVNQGFKEAGYEYIVIDDCWQLSRDKDGKIVADPEKFPAGIKTLADYIHSRGLKFGIYSCAGLQTCGKRPGSHGYEVIDANTYAEWGVDYLKYDWCNTEGIDPKIAYSTMSAALGKSGRPIVFSMCEWGYSRPWSWAQNVGHLWRTTLDIQDCWDCRNEWWGKGWVSILDMQEGLEKYAGPGHWNDPDMLEVGNEKMKYNEYISHFSFWCLLAAPLMAGNDIRTMSDSTKTILLNHDAIAIDQDKAGIQGKKVYDDGDFEIYCKPLQNGDLAIIFFNRNNQNFNFPALWEKAGIKGKMYVYDVWKHESIGTTRQIKSVSINGHSVLFYRLSKKGKV